MHGNISNLKSKQSYEACIYVFASSCNQLLIYYFIDDNAQETLSVAHILQN